MRLNNVPGKLRAFAIILTLSMLLSASSCEKLEGITGIEISDRLAGSTQAERLSLCELVSRDELRPSRRDTPETQDNLSRLIEVYDATCGGE